MPNIKSAMKRVRTSAILRVRNRKEKTGLLTQRRVFMAAIEAKDKGKAMSAFQTFASMLDKAVKKGILKKNTADRKKSRAALWLTKI